MVLEPKYVVGQTVRCVLPNGSDFVATIDKNMGWQWQTEWVYWVVPQNCWVTEGEIVTKY